MRHFSTGVMLGTDDLNAWESDFVESCQRKLAAGQITSLSERHVETLENLHSKHFA